MLKTLTKFLIWVEISLFLAYFILLYPNIPLYIKQLKRWDMGLYSLVDTTSPEVQKFAEEAYKYNNVFPEYYIMKEIKYKSDVDNYWNIEYWATPVETIERRSGDCEDIAVLTKSVLDYLEETYHKDYEARLIDQGIHVYVERNIYVNVKPDRPIYGAVPEEIVEEYKGLIGVIKSWFEDVPLWRWVVYFIVIKILFVLIMIWC